LQPLRGVLCRQRETGALCENLVIAGEIGAPMATRCKVDDKRYNGMPVAMIDSAGGVAGYTLCFKDSADEAVTIIRAGIGRGCSLVVNEH
jgi:hypothetical protein